MARNIVAWQGVLVNEGRHKEGVLVFMLEVECSRRRLILKSKQERINLSLTELNIVNPFYK